MKSDLQKEIVSILILIVLLILLVNPFHFWMPTKIEMILVISLVIIFGMFSGIVWRERGGDEREQWHRMLADRFGYLAGALVLVVGILVESLHYMLSPWLAIALGVMLVARILGFIYSRIRH